MTPIPSEGYNCTHIHKLYLVRPKTPKQPSNQVANTCLLYKKIHLQIADEPS